MRKLTRKAGEAGVALVALAALVSPAMAADVVYDNLSGDGSVYYAGQGGHEALDDVHLTQGGDLASVAFRYLDPGPAGSLDAYVTVYDNPLGLDASATVLAGPVLVSGLITGSMGTAQANFPGVDPVGQDVWVGIRFSRDTAGLVISETPTVGTSHDYYREDGNLFWFGGDPVANFSIRVSTGAPVGLPDGVAGPALRLGPPVPNPTRAGASVQVSLEEPGPFRLAVFDATGALTAIVSHGVGTAGEHRFTWDGRDRWGRPVLPGIYFLRLDALRSTAVRKITVSR